MTINFTHDAFKHSTLNSSFLPYHKEYLCGELCEIDFCEFYKGMIIDINSLVVKRLVHSLCVSDIDHENRIITIDFYSDVE